MLLPTELPSPDPPSKRGPKSIHFVHLPSPSWTWTILTAFQLASCCTLPQISARMILLLRQNLHTAKCIEHKCMSSGPLSTCVTITPIEIMEHPCATQKVPSFSFTGSPLPWATTVLFHQHSLAFLVLELTKTELYSIYFHICLLLGKQGIYVVLCIYHSFFFMAE